MEHPNELLGASGREPDRLPRLPWLIYGLYVLLTSISLVVMWLHHPISPVRTPDRFALIVMVGLAGILAPMIISLPISLILAMLFRWRWARTFLRTLATVSAILGVYLIFVGVGNVLLAS